MACIGGGVYWYASKNVQQSKMSSNTSTQDFSLGENGNSSLGSYGSLSGYCGNGPYLQDVQTLPFIGCFSLTNGHFSKGTFLNHAVEVSLSATGTVDLFVDGLAETDNPYVHQSVLGYNLCNDTKGTSCPTRFEMMTHNQNAYLFAITQCLPPTYRVCVMTQKNWDYENSRKK
jgi:hypothetical protein